MSVRIVPRYRLRRYGLLGRRRRGGRPGRSRRSAHGHFGAEARARSLPAELGHHRRAVVAAVAPGFGLLLRFRR